MLGKAIRKNMEMPPDSLVEGPPDSPPDASLVDLGSSGSFMGRPGLAAAGQTMGPPMAMQQPLVGMPLAMQQPLVQPVLMGLPIAMQRPIVQPASQMAGPPPSSVNDLMAPNGEDTLL